MRHEFSTKVKRLALQRSTGYCEAVGNVYGLEPGQRCNAPLSYGVEFDHYPIQATEEGSNGLENCVAVCKTCHKHKTRTFDIPTQAKSKRIRDKHSGIKKAKKKIPSRGFKAYKPNVKQVDENYDG